MKVAEERLDPDRIRRHTDPNLPLDLLIGGVGGIPGGLAQAIQAHRAGLPMGEAAGTGFMGALRGLGRSTLETLPGALVAGAGIPLIDSHPELATALMGGGALGALAGNIHGGYRSHRNVMDEVQADLLDRASKQQEMPMPKAASLVYSMALAALTKTASPSLAAALSQSLGGLGQGTQPREQILHMRERQAPPTREEIEYLTKSDSMAPLAGLLGPLGLGAPYAGSEVARAAEHLGLPSAVEGSRATMHGLGRGLVHGIGGAALGALPGLAMMAGGMDGGIPAAMIGGGVGGLGGIGHGTATAAHNSMRDLRELALLQLAKREGGEKTAMDPSMAAALLGHLAPTALGAAGGALAGGPGGRLSGGLIGGLAGGLGAHLGGHGGDALHHAYAHNAVTGEGLPQALMEQAGLSQHGAVGGGLQDAVHSKMQDLATTAHEGNMALGGPVLPQHVQNILHRAGGFGQGLGQIGSHDAANLAGHLAGGAAGGGLGALAARASRPDPRVMAMMAAMRQRGGM